MAISKKHTPAPWVAVADHPQNACIRVRIDDHWLSDEIATIYGPHEGEKDKNGVYPIGEERMANARLIAAAPELLAALLDAQTRLRGAGMLGGNDDPVNIALRSVE